MDLSGIPTPKIDWEASNLPEQWRKFQSHVRLIFDGPLADKAEEIKVNYLLLWIGDKGREIRNTWTDLDTEENAEARKKLQTLYDRYQAYVQPKLNPIFARYKFNNEVQGAGTIEQFVTKLRVLARDCAYASCDEMIRDRIVFGTSSDKVREKLINEGEKLTLDKAIQVAQSYEYSQQQLKSMTQQEVHSVKRGAPSGHQRRTNEHRAGRHSNGHKPSYPGSRQQAHGHMNGDMKRHSSGSARKSGQSECGRCGFQHNKLAICPAKGKQCQSCNKYNHFSKKCFFKGAKVHDVEALPDSSDSNDEFFIDSIQTPRNANQAFYTLHVGPQKVPVRFKLETGSQANILPNSLFETLGNQGKLQPSSEKLSAYSGHTLDTLGSCQLTCQHKGKSVELHFHVVKTQSTPILGMRPCLDLGLIKLVYTCSVDSPVSKVSDSQPLNKDTVLSEYKDVFEGIGLLKGECHIKTDPSVPPVVHPPRRVPLSLREGLKEELARMESLEIITKVIDPTEWVSSLVVVKNPESGKLRVCIDPKDLNKAILRPHYPTKTLEDVLLEISCAKYFSKLDAKSGYWNIKLDEESSPLTTFNTPFGRYRYLRLPFGLKSSQDEFQQKMDECYEGLEGAVALVDDVLVYGKTRSEHDKNLREALLRSRERGIKLNKDKLEVGLTCVKYFGHTLTADGLKPDEDKVRAVQLMKPPTNKSELETFLGMVTYLSKFAPNLSELTSPLRVLLTQNIEFHWDKPQADAFRRVKDIITASPVLAYFDPNKEVILQTDASKFGLGATLMQEGKPVAYASKSLTPSEINYAQIEKEMYGIVFGCNKFHQYLYGRKVKVETDHKPLIPISQKSLHAAPPRLQRMLLRVQKYDLDLVYVPGKQIPVADTLSRNFLSDTYPSLSKGMDAHVHTILPSIPISDRKLEKVRDSTNVDTQFQTLINTILNGWPGLRRDCPPSILEFWNHRDELSYVDGLILKGTKVLIPKSLRPEILNALHTGHMGIEKCLKRARCSVFWPKLNADVTELVSECPVCIKHSYSNAKEPLAPHPIPLYPWQVLATDLFESDGKDYIVVVDYYSCYFEVTQLHSTTSKAVINALKPIFTRFGIPEKVVSDNGPQYSSQEFADFSRQYDFLHVTSSPRYPQSNGLAEKYVQIAKRLLIKAKDDGRDPYLGMLEYRTTPLDTGYSPAQLLQGRQLRSVLPTLSQELIPKVINHAEVKVKLEAKRKEEKKQFDKGSKELPRIKVGQKVHVQQSDKTWKPATILSQEADRSFLVESAGKMYRRNRRHLLKRSNPRPSVDLDLPMPSVIEPQVTYNGNTQLSSTLTPKVSQNPISHPKQPETVPTVQPYMSRSGRVCKPKVIVSM
ncbi:uncharacterized protein K02A2.6-like [Mizuhopecten yessoensis]|uniref:uncharacterized protein K02A2.6-like n=1 Tax=Mizuhopecten yessoensis TaxID=6573 RepID=UPI000B45EBCF|nr:uncharacterized protein K02A2.6-like [Mizuhopecten yessoensis]